MRIALYGGSFNPIHNGHLILASFAKHELKLDKVIFVPSNITPGKEKEIIDAQTRFYMVSSLFDDDSDTYDVSDLETRRLGTSYTIDTVKIFKEIYPNDELFLICGPDAILTIEYWKDAEELKNLIGIKIANRDFYCPDVSIRSTQIRELLKNKLPITHLVPKSVEKFIIENNLYGENNEHFL
ncbi:MAG: nicotinate (nicotinamide) nucleotide adenylyltransferase [Novosphingobium sp.]|nr:nicotinate (nicotinamide) nucleotide adenylyltransferase [Novosphingobium sp.]